jgi:hypothetical protein
MAVTIISNPQPAVVGPGGTVRFSALGAACYRWSVAGNTDPATVIAPNGVLTVGNGETGSVTVSVENEGKYEDYATVEVTISIPEPIETSRRTNTSLQRRLTHNNNYLGFIPGFAAFFAAWVLGVFLLSWLMSWLTNNTALVASVLDVDTTEAASHLGWWWSAAAGWSFVVGFVYTVIISITHVFSWNRREDDAEDAARHARPVGTYRIGHFRLTNPQVASCAIFTLLTAAVLWSAKVGESVIFGWLKSPIGIVVAIVILILVLRKLLPFVKKTATK